MHRITPLILIKQQRLPKFKNHKVYPILECDICNNHDIVETCPLENCDTKMCSQCWYKILTDFNGQCPTCRRIMPPKKPTLCEKIERVFLEYICPIHIRTVILPFLLMIGMFMLFPFIGWFFFGFKPDFWDRFFVFFFLGLIALVAFTIIVYALDSFYRCTGGNTNCNPIRRIRNLYSDCLTRRRRRRELQRLRRAEFERRRVSWLL